MAIFMTSLRAFTRAKGESATAAAAYRAGIAIMDERVGLTHDFTNRVGVEMVRTVVPTDAPQWATNIAQLWNAAEAAETRINSRLARELIVALPHELSISRRATLASEVAQVLVDRYGVAVQLAIHAPDRGGDQRNHHAHLLFTTRSVGPSGFGAKVRVLDDRKTGPEEVTWLREKVAELTNAALASAGSAERVDHRTLAAQAEEAELAGDYERAARLTREPTKHQGRAASAAARRGELVRVVTNNRQKSLDHQDALAAYLRSAQAEGRLLAASNDRRPTPSSTTRPIPSRASFTLPWATGATTRPVRATGPGAAILNAQAAAQAEAARRSKKAGDDYLRDLDATMTEARRWLDEFAALAGRRHELEAWLSRTQDTEALRLMQKSVETLRELRQLEVSRRASRRMAAAAERSRQACQKAADEHEQVKPSRWAVVRQREWEKVRRAKWSALRQAIAHEQQSCVSANDMEGHREKTRALREDLRRFEHELRHRSTQKDMLRTTPRRSPLEHHPRPPRL